MAAIFDFNGRGRLGREWNLYQRGGRRSRIRRGLGEWKLRLPEVIVVLRNSVPRRKEFLIGAVKLQLSITSQICHLDILLLRGNAKDGKLCKWWSCYFQIPLSKRHLIKCLSEFNMPRALKLWQKEAISSLERIYWPCCQKSLIFEVLVCMKEIMTGKLSSEVVICPLQRFVYDQME